MCRVWLPLSRALSRATSHNGPWTDLDPACWDVRSIRFRAASARGRKPPAGRTDPRPCAIRRGRIGRAGACRRSRSGRRTKRRVGHMGPALAEAGTCGGARAPDPCAGQSRCADRLARAPCRRRRPLRSVLLRAHPAPSGWRHLWRNGTGNRHRAHIARPPRRPRQAAAKAGTTALPVVAIS